MDLLIEKSAQAGGIEAEAPLLRAIVGIEVKLRGGMAVHMAIKAGDTRGLASALTIICQVDPSGHRRQEHPQAVELHRREDL